MKLLTLCMIPICMAAHLLPKLFHVGEYEIDKVQFVLTHANQRKDSTGRKRRIEYACDDCGSLYVTKLLDEQTRQFPWCCRSCNSQKLWKTESYRNAVLSGLTEQVKEIHRQNRRKSSLRFWSDPSRREEMSQKLRARDPSVYSKARKSMRKSVCFTHWRTQEELVCVGSYECAFVKWCNVNQIDFDWQIPFRMPDKRTYIVDAFIKTGEFANTWIEIKGFMSKVGREKWEWFRTEHQTNSALWCQKQLLELGILNEASQKKGRRETPCL